MKKNAGCSCGECLLKPTGTAAPQDIFQRWTNDVYISNQHRVISPPGKPRYSIATFYHLNHDTPVRCIETCVDHSDLAEGAKYEEIRYIDYLISRFNAVQQLGVKQETALEKVGHVTPPECHSKM